MCFFYIVFHNLGAFCYSLQRTDFVLMFFFHFRTLQNITKVIFRGFMDNFYLCSIRMGSPKSLIYINFSEVRQNRRVECSKSGRLECSEKGLLESSGFWRVESSVFFAFESSEKRRVESSFSVALTCHGHFADARRRCLRHWHQVG